MSILAGGLKPPNHNLQALADVQPPVLARGVLVSQKARLSGCFCLFEVSRNIAQNAPKSAQSQGFVIGQNNVVLALTARARQANLAAALSTRFITVTRELDEVGSVDVSRYTGHVQAAKTSSRA